MAANPFGPPTRSEKLPLNTQWPDSTGHYNRKRRTHAHRKRARSALSKERMLELQQWCTTSRECSAQLDKGHKNWIVMKQTVTKRDPIVPTHEILTNETFFPHDYLAGWLSASQQGRRIRLLKTESLVSTEHSLLMAQYWSRPKSEDDSTHKFYQTYRCW